MDLQLPLTPGTVRSALFLLGMLVARGAVVTVIATLLCNTRWARRRTVVQGAIASSQMRKELVAALGVVAVDAVVIALVLHAQLLETITASPTLDGALWVTASFLLMFVWFEIWFYVTHRLFHTRALFWIHRQHHVARVTQPLSALSFSVLERLVLLAGTVGAAVLVNQFVPVSIRGLEIYLWLNYILNVAAHSNVELTSRAFGRSPLGAVFIGTAFHSLHHVRLMGHYGLFVRVIDRALGTEFSDYEAVREQAARGESQLSAAVVERDGGVD
jgi:Delta7-sterol 5-desaturase